MRAPRARHVFGIREKSTRAHTHIYIQSERVWCWFARPGPAEFALLRAASMRRAVSRVLCGTDADGSGTPRVSNSYVPPNKETETRGSRRFASKFGRDWRTAPATPRRIAVGPVSLLARDRNIQVSCATRVRSILKTMVQQMCRCARCSPLCRQAISVRQREKRNRGANGKERATRVSDRAPCTSDPMAVHRADRVKTESRSVSSSVALIVK